MTATVRLLARCSDAPPPPPVGGLAQQLMASTGHARRCTWEPAATASPERWWNGRGPAGPKLGVVFDDGDVWIPHDAPGEISPTAGLVWTDVIGWLHALAEAVTRGGARLTVQEQDFGLRVDASDHLWIRALDWDGRVEDELRLGVRELIGDLTAALQPPPQILLDERLGEHRTALAEAADALFRAAKDK